MELLHQFIMQTGHTLVNNSALQRVWQTRVIDLAIKHKFLMHTVLATSAMHLACIRPEESAELSVLAASHQEIGLTGFRSELQHFSEENCHALFASSILVVFYIPASYAKNNQDMLSIESLTGSGFSAMIDWIRLIRGCHHIIERGRSWLERGPTAVLVPRKAWYLSTNTVDERSHEEDRYLAGLEKLWAPDTPNNVSRYDEEELEAYEDALIKLREAFARMAIAESTVKDCCWCSVGDEMPINLDRRVPRIIAGVLWQMLISEAFFNLMEKRKPIALVLLAHTAIITKRTSEEWWNKSPAMMTIAAVAACLPPQYHPWIEWPQREVGYNSEFLT